MEKLRTVSLFSGCGGMDLGATGGFQFLGKEYSRNSVKVVFANDVDTNVCELFQKNFSVKIKNKDIKKIPSSQIPKHELLLAGFPCQSFSIVAQNPPRTGMNSDIGKLFFELIRVLKDKRPLCFIAENVKGILSVNKGKSFPKMIELLQKAGYVVDYRVLNSKDFRIPQRRERVFIIGFRNDLGLTPTFPEPVGKGIPLRKVLFPKNQIDKKYYFSKKAVEGMKRANKKMNKGRSQNVNEPCSTVGAHLAKVSLNSTDPVLKEKEKYRRFTPREVARIQSFPDSFELIHSDSKQYRALGNAVPPVMMWYISRTVLQQISNLKKNEKTV